MLSQVPQVVGVVEVFESGRIASKLFVVGAKRSRILHAAMDHFLFPFPPHLKLNGNHYHQSEDAHHSHHQKQRQQNIAFFAPAPEL